MWDNDSTRSCLEPCSLVKASGRISPYRKFNLGGLSIEKIVYLLSAKISKLLKTCHARSFLKNQQVATPCRRYACCYIFSMLRLNCTSHFSLNFDSLIWCYLFVCIVEKLSICSQLTMTSLDQKLVGLVGFEQVNFHVRNCRSEKNDRLYDQQRKFGQVTLNRNSWHQATLGIISFCHGF